MLSDSCMIATFTGKMWHGRKYDDVVTREIAEKKHAKKKAGRYNKTLMPDDAVLKQIKQHLAAMRHYHYDNTLPWTWKGGQLLPSDMFLDYTKEMGNRIRAFDTLANSFCDPNYYEKAKQKAQLEVGDLYKDTDYPLPANIRKFFYAVIDTDPVPSSGDIRVDLPNEEVQKLKANWVAKEGQIVQAATEHLWTKLHDLTEKFEERTGDPNNNFHKTLTSNIRDFTDILGKLNIGEDRFLKDVGDQVAKLAKYEIDDLKKDTDVRSEAAEEAGGLLKKIKSQMEAFNA